MNTKEIAEVLKLQPCADQIFKGVFACDDLPLVVKYPCALVANTDPQHKPGEHWIAMYFANDGTGEYFDSFGLPPPKVFERYLEKHSKRWIRNSLPLQDVWTKAGGPFCIFYVWYRCCGKSMYEIVTYLRHKTNNDDYVTQFVKSLL